MLQSTEFLGSRLPKRVLKRAPSLRFLQKLGAAVLIAVHHSVGMVPHCSGGNVLVDGSGSGQINCLSLGSAGNGAEHVLCLHQSGHSQRKGVGGYIIQGGETSVVNLLIAAHLIQRNQLNQCRIVEVCDPGIVEGDVCVLADAQENDVGRISSQKLAVTAAFFLGILCDAVDVINLAEGKLAENVVVEISTKALGTLSAEAYVLIHVEGAYTRPIDPLLCQQNDLRQYGIRLWL